MRPRVVLGAKTKETLTTKEAAEFLGCHVESVRRLARTGAIPSFKIGKDWRFSCQALDRWMEEQHTDQQPALALIVDDEKAVRTLLRRTLEAAGYRVTEASDGDEGMFSVNLEKPDVIFVDLAVNGVNGPEFLARLRAHDASIPVVVLTGYPDGELMQQALRHGPLTLLTKPAPAEQLMKALDIAQAYRQRSP